MISWSSIIIIIIIIIISGYLVFCNSAMKAQIILNTS